MNRRRKPEPNRFFQGLFWVFAFWIVVGMVSCQYAHADEFSTPDWQRQWAYTALHVADWGTTLDIKNHPDLHEINPILGKHPSDAQINTYMAGSLAAHWAVSYLLPADYRPYWQYITIGVEGVVVAHNLSIGLHVNF